MLRCSWISPFLHQVGGKKVERLEQRLEVVAVLIDAAGRVRTLAARVAAAVISNVLFSRGFGLAGWSLAAAGHP